MSLRLKRSIIVCLAASGVCDERMMCTISSMLSCAISRPCTICRRSSAFFRSKRTAHHHVVAVIDEMLDQIAHRQHLGTAVHQRDIVHCKRSLQRRILEKRVQHDAGDGVVFENDDDAKAVAVRFVVDVGDALDLLLVDHVGDLLDHLGLVDHVGNLGDDDALAAAGVCSISVLARIITRPRPVSIASRTPS